MNFEYDPAKSASNEEKPRSTGKEVSFYDRKRNE